MICPKCGKGNLHINYVQQYAMRHKLGKDGRVLKEVKKVYMGPEDWSFLDCDNCDFYLSANEKVSFNYEGNKIVFDEDFDQE